MIGYKYPEPTVGDRYTGWIDAAQVSKNVRAEIAQAKKTGDLPKTVKASVRCQKYAGGQSVSVKLSGLTRDEVWTVEANGDSHMTPQAKAILHKVEAMRNAYNRDASDPMTDYYNVTYYGSTDWAVYPWSE